MYTFVFCYFQVQETTVVPYGVTVFELSQTEVTRATDGGNTRTLDLLKSSQLFQMMKNAQQVQHFIYCVLNHIN